MPPPPWIAALGAHDHVLERAWIRHDLGWAALLAGQERAAAHQFEEGLALCRSQRAARPVQGPLLTGLSTADRLQGHHHLAERRARVALDGTPPQQRFTASLALATVLRLGGDPDAAILPYQVALTVAPAHYMDDVHALLSLVMPAHHRPEATRLWADTRTRVFLQDAEGLLTCGVTPQWSQTELTTLAVRDEARALPRVLVALSLALPSPSALAVQVVLHGRMGLRVAGRFVPVPGDGQTLTLLAYLIEHGSAPWTEVAEAVLTQPGSEQVAYVQVKYHLARLRGMLGDPDAIRLRRRRLSLATHWQWSTDRQGADTDSDLVGSEHR
ncbi:hypothetical protein [uncultured Deinococcus sp.]|uniref:hypothetical protein n=1 Tax=uncultured Deinococcus sp. TaxID=158789 RepID=UPI0025D2B69B|nr:hypothetical protein [uncultured Deinococcus sp.]